MHIGSGTDLEHLRQVCGAMERAALEVGDGIEAISAGGGLPVPYREGESYVDLAEYFSLWDGVRRRLAESFGHAVRLEIEPGRYLVAESGLSRHRNPRREAVRQEHVLSGRCRL